MGYESPIDYYNGNLKKGALFTKDNDYEGCYSAPHDNRIETLRLYLPAEIVTTWQPIYAKTEAELQAEMWEEVFDDLQTAKYQPNVKDYFKKQTKFKLVKSAS